MENRIEEKDTDISTEVIGPQPGEEGYALVPTEGEYMEQVIDVSDKLEKYEKALNAIMNFIIKRTYPGDWVSHDKAGTPEAERTVNMIGAAAERIARDLGINETNLTPPVKIMNEDFPGHYRYECQGDFTFRGRTIRAIGIASTRNPFYYKVGGGERKPSDIREEYIMREAMRDRTKQAIKGLFGLRKIPLLKLQELGYDIKKVKYVDFKEGEGTSARKEAGKSEVVKASKSFTFVKHESKVGSDNRPYQVFTTDQGISLSFWRPLDDEDVQRLILSIANEELAIIEYRDNGKYRNIDKVVEVVSQ